MNNKRKVYSRKGNCPACNVQTGSQHNKICEYAYKGMPNSKRNQKNSTIYKMIADICNEVGTYTDGCWENTCSPERVKKAIENGEGGGWHRAIFKILNKFYMKGGE